MKISVKVTPNAKENKISEGGLDLYGRGFFKIKINQVPEDGKANEAVIKLLADFFKIKKRDIKIVLGETSRDKVVEISI